MNPNRNGRNCWNALAIGLVFVMSASHLPVAQQGNQTLQPSASDQGNKLLEKIKLTDCTPILQGDLLAASSALDLFRVAHDVSGETTALVLFGTMHVDQGEYKAAEPYLVSALDKVQKRDMSLELRLRVVLGDVYNHLGQQAQAADSLAKALELAATLKDTRREAAALTFRGDMYYGSDNEKALHDYEQARVLSDQVHDLKTEAIALSDEGAVYDITDAPQKALGKYQSALRMERQSHFCRQEVDTLTNLGAHYEDRGQTREALDAYSEASRLENKVGKRDSEAYTLHNIAHLYDEAGDAEKALHFYRRALAIEQETGNIQAEGPTQRDIAGLYLESGDLKSAMDNYKDALLILKKTEDRQSEALALNNVGYVQSTLGDPKQARDYYTQAVQTALQAGNSIVPAYSEWGIGSLEESDALPNYFRALVRSRSLDLPELEGLVDDSLMNHFRIHKQPQLAILFGKEAVDKFQTIRKNMNGLNGLTRSFVKSKTQTYRTLASLLIDEQRLAEAQQILDLLKVQEYSDYVRGPTTTAGQKPTRTPAEAEFDEQYQKMTADLVPLDQQIQKWDSEHHDVTDPDYVRAQQTIDKAGENFEEYLQQVKGRLSKSYTNRDYFQLNQQVSMLQDAISRYPNTVALYTLVAEDRYRVIVVTKDLRIWRSYPISGPALSRKCHEYLQLLQDKKHPNSESNAKELFKIVFGPVQKDVENSGATTLVWSLDGALRYIPVGALLDPVNGRYIVDSYSTVNYAPFNFSLIDTPNLTDATAIAMGTSRDYDSDLGPLPHVKTELDEIVKDPNLPDSRGLLPGTILLDGKFTETAMEKSIAKQAVVHIASHFFLTPTNDALSFLLLGGKDQDSQGYHLSVTELRKAKVHLEGKELVTLSACRTAAETNAADGTEKEGISEAILEKRAKAVISSLWEVNDESTGQLMADFYKTWMGSKKNMTKAQALRQAELDLLHGKIVPRQDLTNPNAPTSFANPYYWAPFVLMGNWQ